MSVAEWIAQILGLVVAVTVLIVYQMKKRWQILAISAASNLLSGVSFLLLGGVSASVICFVATLHTSVNLIHARRGAVTARWEYAVFLLLYIVGGALQYKTVPDLLPIAAAVLFMLAMSQTKEQLMRLISVGNIVIWIIYDIIVRSSAVFAQLIALIAVTVALYRYRKTD